MFCSKCGNIMPGNARRCSSCGALVEKSTKVNTPCDHPHNTTFTESVPAPVYNTNASQNNYGSRAPKVQFLEAIEQYFIRYVDFHGRSRRSEFWFAVWFISFVSSICFMFGMIGFVWWLLTVIPTAAISVRRLHDVGLPGTRLFLVLIPIFGFLLLVFLFLMPSGPANEWGPNPELQ